MAMQFERCVAILGGHCGGFWGGVGPLLGCCFKTCPAHYMATDGYKRCFYMRRRHFALNLCPQLLKLAKLHWSQQYRLLGRFPWLEGTLEKFWVGWAAFRNVVLKPALHLTWQSVIIGDVSICLGDTLAQICTYNSQNRQSSTGYKNADPECHPWMTT